MEETYPNQQEKQQGVPRGGRLVLLEAFKHLRTPKYKIVIQCFTLYIPILSSYMNEYKTNIKQI